MTTAEAQIAALAKMAAKHPHRRLYVAMEQLKAVEKVNQLRNDTGYVSWPRRFWGALTRGWWAV